MVIVKKLLFATSNTSKVMRFKSKLLEHNIDLISVNDIDVKLDIVESGKTAIENARIKALAYFNATGIPTIAMDDNLFFENVDDDIQPGVYVRRVNGKELSDEEMIEYYSNLAKKYGDNGRLTARWVYGMVYIDSKKEDEFMWSLDDFYIVDVASDKINPGYPLNSISINKKLNKYFTDILEEEKLLVKKDINEVIDFIVKNIEV